MRARIDRNQFNLATEIWLYKTIPGDKVLVRDSAGVWAEHDSFEQGIPPTLTLRESEWEALLRAVGEHTQSSDATVEALKDTRQIRDRLLALVEKQHHGTPADGV